MKRFTFDEYGDLYIGSAREISSLYRNLATKANAFPRFVNMPILYKDRMYGLHIEESGEYKVLNASTCLKVLVD